MPARNPLGSHELNSLMHNGKTMVFCSECAFSIELGDRNPDAVLDDHDAYRERTSAFASGKEWAQKNIVDGPGWRGSLTLSARTDLEASFNNGMHAALMESKFRSTFESSHIDGLDEISWERN